MTEADLEDIATSLADIARAGDVIALFGPLGAGKTTFARQFIRARAARLGLEVEEVPSPTFTLVQTYDIGTDTVWHFDLYRVGAADELWEIGLEEALGGGICLIEWPARAGSALPASRIDIILDHTDNPQDRTMTLIDRCDAGERLTPVAACLSGVQR